jgi:Family of unknown function (DUF5695)
MRLRAILLGIAIAITATLSFAQDSYEGGDFRVHFGEAGVTSVQAVHDTYGTEFLAPHRALGELVVHYRPSNEEKWKEAMTAKLDGQRHAETQHEADGLTRTLSYEIDSANQKWLMISESFRATGESLVWTIDLANLSQQPIEIGDLGFPLKFNNEFSEDETEIFEKRVIKHDFISGDGSFAYWERPSGHGPALVMTVMPGTHLEYFDLTDQVRGVNPDFYAYIHSALRNHIETHGTWRQPITSATLAPSGSNGDTVHYALKFRWAADTARIRDVLYQEGIPDVRVLPGMTVPTDLVANILIRSKDPIESLSAEFPEKTKIEFVGEKQKDMRLYRVSFAKLGENEITVHFGAGRKSYLEFFATEPLETLIKKRTAFLINHQQHRDASKWYDGLISVWDMRTGTLRGPDNTDGFDGWWGYVLACDDTALPKAGFIAAKNVIYPDAREIAGVEYYIQNFVWGKLQRTDKETPYPYGIYGVPNWHENRTSEYGFGSNGKGLEHIWRLYDYPHIVMLYYEMYEVAKENPQLVHYLDADGYLERATQTAKAYFEYPYKILPWYEVYKWGAYNELLIPKLIATLREKGRTDDANWLTAEWEKKVKYFIYDDKYPFRSEYSFDTTAYESTEAFGRYALDHTMQPDHDLWFDTNLKRWYSHPEISRDKTVDFMKNQMAANLACRGTIEPAYNYLGGDIRGDSSRYGLSYMSQMGGWAILDYALNFADDPSEYLRIGYASILSSWALMNTGTADSDYGYWFPGPQNDGASGWGFQPVKWGDTWIRKEQGRGAWFYDGEIDLGYSGALRGAATIVTEDPLFGTIALGGALTTTADYYEVIPRDGVRQRFDSVSGTHIVQLSFEQDGFAREVPITIRRDQKGLTFAVENRGVGVHNAALHLSGLPNGTYALSVNGAVKKTFASTDREPITLQLPVAAAGDRRVEIAPKS